MLDFLEGARMLLRESVSTVLTVSCLMLFSQGADRGCAAQALQTMTPGESHRAMTGSNLDALLRQLQDRLDEFNRTIKSFECAEHIVSSRTPAPNGSFSLRETTDSIFRVRRSDDPRDLDNPENDPDNPTRHNLLHESRVVTKEDGRAVSGGLTRLDSPYIFFGIFIGGLTHVTTSAAACFHYTLHPSHKQKIVIDFVRWPRHDAAIYCPYPEGMSGRVWVDEATMRIERVEAATKDYEVQKGVRGTWRWSVVFRPTVLGGDTFWLPTSIQSEEEANNAHGVAASSSGGKTQADHVWYALSATYTDYRLLRASARILPSRPPDR